MKRSSTASGSDSQTGRRGSGRLAENSAESAATSINLGEVIDLQQLEAFVRGGEEDELGESGASSGAHGSHTEGRHSSHSKHSGDHSSHTQSVSISDETGGVELGGVGVDIDEVLDFSFGGVSALSSEAKAEEAAAELRAKWQAAASAGGAGGGAAGPSTSSHAHLPHVMAIPISPGASRGGAGLPTVTPVSSQPASSQGGVGEGSPQLALVAETVHPGAAGGGWAAAEPFGTEHFPPHGAADPFPVPDHELALALAPPKPAAAKADGDAAVGRNAMGRKDWSAQEDALILQQVRAAPPPTPPHHHPHPPSPPRPHRPPRPHPHALPASPVLRAPPPRRRFSCTARSGGWSRRHCPAGPTMRSGTGGSACAARRRAPPTRTRAWRLAPPRPTAAVARPRAAGGGRSGSRGLTRRTRRSCARCRCVPALHLRCISAAPALHLLRCISAVSALHLPCICGCS